MIDSKSKKKAKLERLARVAASHKNDIPKKIVKKNCPTPKMPKKPSVPLMINKDHMRSRKELARMMRNIGPKKVTLKEDEHLRGGSTKGVKII